MLKFIFGMHILDFSSSMFKNDILLVVVTIPVQVN